LALVISALSCLESLTDENRADDHSYQHPHAQKYFVSTIEGIAGWQTAVFRKKFGPFANFRKPAFCLGGSDADHAADQHERTVAIVRDIDPANWEEASHRLAVQVINEWAAAQEVKDAAW
jgi:hypothetical protein